nr:asparagine synthase (glutamine-hydrolyzing) [uncultured Chitinophaga sp.]
MCGICGFITINRPLSGNEKEIITAMNKSLLHRGPDEQHIVQHDNVVFGFSRLSIIGLDNGMQPVYNEDKSIMLICNGEIFNYIELREQLSKRGHVFSTKSDVEVIIHLYEESGTGFLNELNGQFAFALYDFGKKSLFCARDQMGIIPFFYTYVGHTFVFASEIKAILRHPLVSKEIDLTGLDQIFTFPGLISPRTMFKDIRSLENGHCLTLSAAGKLTDKEYWDLIFPREGDVQARKPDNYYIGKLEALFENAVRLRLRSDVPSGFYLSGGLDSSMIAKKVCELSPGKRNQAFSIDFVDSRLSESIYQRLMAEESNAELNRKMFFFDDISERLRQSVYHSECPIKETYNTASMALSESVRSKGIKVILSGEGADEFFAGYVGYRFDELRKQHGLQGNVSTEEAHNRHKAWGDTSFFYENDFSALNQVKKQLYSRSINDVFDEINCLGHHVVDQEKIAGRHACNKRSYVDYKLRLVDHLVSDHGDRMALANSVEVRYPFLDRHLVEFAATLPPDLKIRDITEKYILKKMAEKFLPRTIIEREKFGFVAPGSPYLLQKNIPYIEDLLSYDLIKRQGYFNPGEIERLHRMYSQDGFYINAPFESDLLIVVITFGILLDTFFN